MTSSIEAYKLWQQELREFGETKEAMSLPIRLPNLMRRHLAVGFNAEPEAMHRAAYPEPATRPQRYTIGTTTVCPIER